MLVKSARTDQIFVRERLAWLRCQKKKPPAARMSIAAAAIPYFSRGLRFPAGGRRAQARLQSLQIVAQFRGGGVPQGAILLQKLADDPFQLDRDLRIPLANRLGRLVQESLENHRGRCALKGPRARHHFVQDHAKGPQVAARIDGLRRGLVRATCKRPCPSPCPAR